MCISPIQLKDCGLVACSKCWQCRANQIDDKVGRCIAETRHTAHTYAVTLTYGGGDTPESAVLYYPHFQQMLKRMRKRGLKIRYLVCGEYGSKKLRAHWHAILFCDQPLPVFPEAERFDWQFWPHGHTWIEKPSFKAIRYVLKYALKDEAAAVSVRRSAMSKKPPLGFLYFQKLAEQYVQAGLAPQDGNYRFHDEMTKNGRPRLFSLSARSEQLYVQHFVDTWEKEKCTARPESDYVDKVIDQIYKPSAAVLWHELCEGLVLKDKRWADPRQPKMVVKAVCRRPGCVIAKNETGNYQFLKYDIQGNLLWQRTVLGRAEMRQALQGRLPQIVDQEHRRSLRPVLNSPGSRLLSRRDLSASGGFKISGGNRRGPS